MKAIKLKRIKKILPKFPTSIFPLFGYLYAFGKGKKTSNITLPSNRQMTVIVCGENQDEVA